MDDVLTNEFITKCPIFTVVFRNLIRDGNVDQLYKDNHYRVDDKYMDDYELELDLTILEMLLKDLYGKTITNYFNPFMSYYGPQLGGSNDFLVYYLDMDISSELHILDTNFGLTCIRTDDSFVYHSSSAYSSKVIASKFKFRKDELEPFISKLNYERLDKCVKKMMLENKLM